MKWDKYIVLVSSNWSGHQFYREVEATNTAHAMDKAIMDDSENIMAMDSIKKSDIKIDWHKYKI